MAACWLEKNDNSLWRLLNMEPRGGGLMCSMLLMPPPNEVKAHCSIIIIEQGAYFQMCSHCAIGTAMTIVAEGMIKIQEPVTTMNLETPAGLVIAEVTVQNEIPVSVTITNVEPFLLKEDATIKTQNFGHLSIDFA